MRIRYRLMLTGAGVLAVALGAVALWPEPAPPAPPAAMFAASEPEPMSPPPPPPAPPPQVVPVSTAAPEVRAPEPRHDGPTVTVARMEPEPMPPEPELSHPPLQYNDELEPELPQTTQWELEKTSRLAALVERDVVRLAREREDALARGDLQRGEQLDLMLQRNLGQLRELHDEIRKLVAEVNGLELTE
ncbi:hypothetical protein [Myxococcus sp. Y35]|uniref:hypothetical protein n=1 Tax=Pseudomyxococcus flavus TaxID=3115648 RepID=UPI003CE9B308